MQTTDIIRGDIGLPLGKCCLVQLLGHRPLPQVIGYDGSQGAGQSSAVEALIAPRDSGGNPAVKVAIARTRRPQDGCMDAWMDAWMDGWMEGWMDGWMRNNECTYIPYKIFERARSL